MNSAMTKEDLREIGRKNPFTGGQGFFVSRDGMAAKILRRFILFGFYHLIERSIPAGSRVLDFGCGGGTAWLAKRYRVTGLDASDESVRACSQLYSDTIAGDICNTGFSTGCYDAVVSKFVLEHLPEEAAAEALTEIARVLKPGGYFISLCDLECDHPQLAWVRRHYPETYQQLYVLDPGHVGLRRAKEWNALIRDAGLEVIEWRETSRFPVLDHHPLGQLSKAPELPVLARWCGNVALKIASVKALVRMWTITTAILEDTIGRCLPRRWSYRLVFAVRKPESASLRTAP
jgi:SAM-dependent methyltransferase